MATGFIDSDEEWLARRGGDGSAEGNFAMADGYNRMANSEVEAYNSRPAPSDWDGELAHQQVMDTQRQTQDRNAAMAQRINTQRGVLDGYVRYGIGKIEKAKQVQDIWGDHLASAMLLASRNNGQLPQYMIPGLNEARGLDGKTATIYGGGYTKDGKGFVLAVARKDPQTGQITPDRDASVQLDLRGMYDLMYNKPGIFSRQQLQGVHDLLSEQVKDRSSGQDSLPDIPKGWGEVGNVGVGNRTETGGTAVPSSWLYGPQRRSSISAFGSDGRGGFTQYDSDESTGYRLQSRDFGTRERTWDGMSERERVARINAASRERQAQTDADAKIAAAEVRGVGRGTGAGTSRGTSAGGQHKLDKEWLAAIKDRIRETADTIENDEGEIVDNPNKNPEKNKQFREMLDNALLSGNIEGQRDAEKSAPPPQQRLVYYRDAQGNLKSGNGYVQDGKVYGVDGRLIEGAREIDSKGRPVPTPEEARKMLAEKKKARATGGGRVDAAKAATIPSVKQTAQTPQGGKTKQPTIDDDDLADINATVERQTSQTQKEEIESLLAKRNDKKFRASLRPEDEVLYDAMLKTADGARKVGADAGRASESTADAYMAMYEALAKKFTWGKVRNFLKRMDETGRTFR